MKTWFEEAEKKAMQWPSSITRCKVFHIASKGAWIGHSQKKKDMIIILTFFNHDIIFYTFRDIKHYFENLSSRKVVLYNCKYFNQY